MESRYFSLIFCLSLIAGLRADYCSGPSNSSCCCAYKDVGEKTCRGSGTSGVAELIGKLLGGKETYAVFGQYEGLYYVISISYTVAKSGRATVYFHTLYAYVIEVPNILGGHTYYYIAVTGCLNIFILTESTPGYVKSTTLPLKTVYQIIILSNQNSTCDGPCNSITSSYPPCTARGIFDQLDFDLPLDYSNAIAFQYRCMDEKNNSQDPDDAIKKCGLDVCRGNCSSLYVECGYDEGAELCYRPDPGIPLGRALFLTGFPFASLSQKNGPCLLCTKINKFGATASFPYFLYFEKLNFVTYPYNCVITTAGYFSTSLGNTINVPLAQLC